MAERNLLSLRIINGEQATLSSLYSVESGSSCLACKFAAPSESQNITVHAVQCSPSPLISCTASMPQGATVSQITAANSEQLCDQSSSSRVLRDVHISARLMEDFMQLAKENTEKDLETCGTLGAFLKNDTFYVTTLIIPKQESTSSSCQAINDEEVFAIQNEQSLFPVGWIHVNDSVVHGSILLSGGTRIAQWVWLILYGHKKFWRAKAKANFVWTQDHTCRFLAPVKLGGKIIRRKDRSLVSIGR